MIGGADEVRRPLSDTCRFSTSPKSPLERARAAFCADLIITLRRAERSMIGQSDDWFVGLGGTRADERQISPNGRPSGSGVGDGIDNPKKDRSNPSAAAVCLPLQPPSRA